MLTVWIVFFLIGTLVGRTLDEFVLRSFGTAALALAAAAVVARSSRRGRRAAGVLVATAAVIWGVAHAAPPLASTTADAVIHSVVLTDAGAAGPLLVQVDGALFESYGPQRPGAVGAAEAVPQARLFARHLSHVRARYAPPSEADGSPLSVAVAALRRGLDHRLARQAPFVRAWLGGIILGEKTAMPRGVIDAFKRTGLYHLLAVSGLHVSLIAWLLAALLRAPAQLAYAARLISPCAWRHVAAGLHVAAAGIAVVYLAATGTPAAAQRSTIIFVVWQLGAVFWGVLPLGRRMLLAAALQALLFPLGFLSEATLMSWSAYLLVLDRPASPVRGAFALQAKLMLLVTAAFGQLSLLGLVANLLFVPLFSLLLVLGLLVAAWPGLPGHALVLALHRSFVEMIRLSGDLCDRVPWLAPPAEALPAFFRPLAAVVSTVALLSTCRNLSMSPYESN